MIKTYLKSYGYLFGLIIILTVFLSIINYFIPFKNNIIKIIIPIISMLISSIVLGKSIKQNACLEGIKFSAVYILFTTMAKILLKTNFNYKIIIMFISLLLASIIGSMIGINLKKE